MTIEKPYERIILNHADLVIEAHCNKQGKTVFTGKSNRYEPYEATAASVYECFFCFNIQLSEQQRIAAFLDNPDEFNR